MIGRTKKRGGVQQATPAIKGADLIHTNPARYYARKALEAAHTQSKNQPQGTRIECTIPSGGLAVTPRVLVLSMMELAPEYGLEFVSLINSVVTCTKL